jgi:hypothetical protein
VDRDPAEVTIVDERKGKDEDYMMGPLKSMGRKGEE